MSDIEAIVQHPEVQAALDRMARIIPSLWGVADAELDLVEAVSHATLAHFSQKYNVCMNVKCVDAPCPFEHHAVPQ